MMVEAVRGTSAISIDAVTTPKMVKKHRETGVANPFLHRGILKFCRMDGLIGFDYENSVNNQATREGKEQRQAKSRAWGTLIHNRLFVEHNDAYYLQMKVQSTDVPSYRDKDDQTVDVELLTPYLPVKSQSSTQSDLNKEVCVRDIMMTNVKVIRFKEHEYALIDGQPNEVEQTRRDVRTGVTETTTAKATEDQTVPA